MRVKITGCCNNGWYSNQIGSIVNVTQGEGKYYIAFTFDGRQYYIEECDSVVVPEETPQPEPFDLERALKGEMLLDFNGCTYLIVGKSHREEGHYIAERFINDRFEGILSVYANGVIMGSGDQLTMAPKEPQVVTRWVNVYREQDGTLSTSTYAWETFKMGESLNTRNPAYIGTFPITITLKP